MKICMVCDGVYPSYSGRGVTTERWSQKLAERGHKVIVFTSRKKNQPKREFVGKVEVYRFSSIPIPKTKKDLYVAFPFPGNIFTILEREKFDILHINSQYYLSFLCVLAAKSLGVPVVAALHMQPENITKNVGVSSKILDSSIYRSLIFVCNLADDVVVPSKLAAKIALENGLKKRCQVISNGIDIEKFRKSDSSAFKNKHGLKGHKVMLFVGRLMKEKNVEFLFKIFPEVLKREPKTKLLIVGDGYLKKPLQQRIKQEGLKNIVLTGRVSKKDLAAAYASADLFILPSIAELQGIVVLEAMASGKPVMVAKANTSAAHELVAEGKNGYTFNLKKPEEVVDKVVRMLKNNLLRKKMGQASLDLVKKHSIEKSIDEIEKIYLKLVRKR